MKKMRRFDEGGYTTIKGPGATSFKEAFSRARSLGQDEFTWNGKRYTTELAKPRAESMSVLKGAERTQARKAAEREEAYQKAREEASKTPYVNPEPGLETDTTLEDVLTGRALYSAGKELFKAGAKKMASRAASKAAETTRKEPYFTEPAAAPRGMPEWANEPALKRGGKVSASSRGDGIAKRGKTKGMIVMSKGGYKR